jgi:hypothetical protein
VCCGACLRYHHQACWTDACSACGAGVTLASKDAARRERRQRLLGLALALTFIDAALFVAAKLGSWSLPLDDVIGIDLLGVAFWIVLVAVVGVVGRLVV